MPRTIYYHHLALIIMNKLWRRLAPPARCKSSGTRLAIIIIIIIIDYNDADATLKSATRLTFSDAINALEVLRAPVGLPCLVKVDES